MDNWLITGGASCDYVCMHISYTIIIVVCGVCVVNFQFTSFHFSEEICTTYIGCCNINYFVWLGHINCFEI